MLVLETAASAKAHGKVALARLAGFGSAYPGREMNTVAGGTRAATAAIRDALDSAGISAGDVDLVVCSANGDPTVDEIDANALSEVIDSMNGGVPRIQPKLQLGETMGAGGAFAALAAMLALVQNNSTGDGQNALVTAIDPQGPCAAMVLSTTA